MNKLLRLAVVRPPVTRAFVPHACSEPPRSRSRTCRVRTPPSHRRAGASAAAAGHSPPGTCALATPGRRLQSPPPPPPIHQSPAAVSLWVRLDWLWQSAFSCGGLCRANRESCTEGGGVSRAEPGVEDGRRLASGRAQRPDSARPGVPVVPAIASLGAFRTSTGATRLAVPFRCGLSTCPPRDQQGAFIYLFVLKHFTCIFGSSERRGTLALALPVGRPGIPSFVMASSRDWGTCVRVVYVCVCVGMWVRSVICTRFEIKICVGDAEVYVAVIQIRERFPRIRTRHNWDWRTFTSSPRPLLPRFLRSFGSSFCDMHLTTDYSIFLSHSFSLCSDDL